MSNEAETSTPSLFLTTVQAESRVRIPKEVVKVLKIKKGDVVEATIKKVEKK